MSDAYVTCPGLITSPAPSPSAQALGLKPNMVCGTRVTVHREAPVMSLRCPYGHEFIATDIAIEREASS